MIFFKLCERYTDRILEAETDSLEKHNVCKENK